MSFSEEPEANAPPPVETWMIPSAFDSARPRKTALTVVSEVTLNAGRAKRPARARSSMLQYVLKSATGMALGWQNRNGAGCAVQRRVNGAILSGGGGSAY